MRATPSAETGFHAGELDVQRRAGVRAEATRLAGMLAPPDLDGGPRNFLSHREFAVLTARDSDGTLWTHPLVGPPGFLAAQHTTLRVRLPRDRPADVPVGQPVGLLAIDFALRRRFRVNGLLTVRDESGLTIEVDQAYGNCPAYIHRRILEPAAASTLASGPASALASGSASARTTSGLTPAQQALIRGADTFFLGTVHPTRGADASHKGGQPGFVRIEGGDLWWPDYAGNNLFNSLGNLTVNPEAALLFVDFATGATLHLSGIAELEWHTPDPANDDGDNPDTGRRIRFHPTHIRPGAPLPVRATADLWTTQSAPLTSTDRMESKGEGANPKVRGRGQTPLSTASR